MSGDTAYKLVKLVILVLVLLLFVMGYSAITAYNGRKALVASQRAGCERAKKDRMANAEGWRIAEAARRASGNIAISLRYATLAASLEERGRIDCKKAFPDATFIP